MIRSCLRELEWADQTNNHQRPDNFGVFDRRAFIRWPLSKKGREHIAANHAVP